MGEQVKTVEKGQIWRNNTSQAHILVLKNEPGGINCVILGSTLCGERTYCLADFERFSLVGVQLDDGRRVMVSERYGFPDNKYYMTVDRILSGGRIVLKRSWGDSGEQIEDAKYNLDYRMKLADAPKVELTRVSWAIGESESFRRAAENNGTPPIARLRPTGDVNISPKLQFGEGWCMIHDAIYPVTTGCLGCVESLSANSLARAETLRATRPKTPERAAEPDDDDGVSAKLDFASEPDISTYTVRDVDGNVIATGPLTNGGATYWTPKVDVLPGFSLARADKNLVDAGILIAGETVKIPRPAAPEQRISREAARSMVAYSFKCDGADKIVESFKHVKAAAEDAAKAASRKLIDNAIRAYSGPFPRAYLSAMVAMSELANWDERNVMKMNAAIVAFEGYLGRGYAVTRAREEAAVFWHRAEELFEVYLRERNRK